MLFNREAPGSIKIEESRVELKGSGAVLIEESRVVLEETGVEFEPIISRLKLIYHPSQLKQERESELLLWKH